MTGIRRRQPHGWSAPADCRGALLAPHPPDTDKRPGAPEHDQDSPGQRRHGIAEVAAGRWSQENANDYVAAFWHNLTTPAPQPANRIAAKFGEVLAAGLNIGGPRAGWYDEGGTARYWDGQQWTHRTTRVEVARSLVRQLAAEEKSALAASVHHPTAIPGQAFSRCTHAAGRALTVRSADSARAAVGLIPDCDARRPGVLGRQDVDRSDPAWIAQ
ncbi:DUF2510 domain-containing protein [Arthrobacter sp. UYEF20]|uniref:DUF2510 domain-containing protein n=1 Tax=Arthrobacter sp. UYEF20 TaxID=1756363 RepID=UPI0033945A69